MPELTYTQNGDYLLPDLELDDMSEDIGKYGMLRKTYLEEHREAFYTGLLLSGELWPHLLEINRTAQERIDRIVANRKDTEGITESLKASDQMEWVRRTNNLLASAEETVLHELVYS